VREGFQDAAPPSKCHQPVQPQGGGLGADNRSPMSDICGEPLLEATLLFRRKRAALHQCKPAESFKVNLVRIC